MCSSPGPLQLGESKQPRGSSYGERKQARNKKEGPVTVPKLSQRPKTTSGIVLGTDFRNGSLAYLDPLSRPFGGFIEMQQGLQGSWKGCAILTGLVDPCAWMSLNFFV